ncbi:MAG: GNAT family N-acetyltransferase, partial [Romboutsia sp.]|uniref:GNAT family N-acetyltransferase n=1 Tax=Romboutsia sp. TaxID=1965302 RepID=UPI003F369D4C
ILKEYGARDIRLSIPKEALHIFEDIGFKYKYKSYEMKLYDAHKIGDTLSLKEVNLNNIKTYLEIYNDSFSDMPHGSITNEDKIKEFLNKDDYYCYFVCDKNEEIGFMEVSIENNKGMFDIGLCKKYRGMKYGYRLLETAIDFLVEKKATVNLIVIGDNEVAYNMYKKRGFKETLTKGYWLKLKD